jgi:23S rRNA (guanosine2251-2'-O)-methyltransferase
MNISDNKRLKYLILDNIRSVHNVGSIFRTADAVGIEKIILVGQSPAPVDRFGRQREDLKKVSLGAEKNVAWEYIESEKLEEVVGDLQSNNFKIIALEQDKNSIDYNEINSTLVDEAGNHKHDLAVVVGNEVNGVSKNILKLADYIVEIPMRGEKESLNVSVSTGIILYKLFC